MTSTRLLSHAYNPWNTFIPSSSSSSSPRSIIRTTRFISKAVANGDKRISTDKERKKSTVAARAAALVASPETTQVLVGDRQRLGLASLLSSLSKVLISTQKRSWRLHVQTFIERVIVDCRFFTLFAVAGSLIGSILCYLEGCFFILESYLHYFHILTQKVDEGHLVHLLIQAMDMFMVGTAMLIFGVGLYVMFVGSKTIKQKGQWIPSSNLFGLFHLKNLPSWVDMESVSQAKSRIGHAVVMILHVGMLEKFADIHFTTSLDLACFAGSVLVSSASLFFLSKLYTKDR